MNIEQFKLLLDAATSAGEGVSWLLVLWMFKGFAQICLFVGLLGGIALGIFRLVNRHLDDELLMARFRRKFDMQSRFGEYEKNLVIKWAEIGRQKMVDDHNAASKQ